MQFVISSRGIIMVTVGGIITPLATLINEISDCWNCGRKISVYMDVYGFPTDSILMFYRRGSLLCVCECPLSPGVIGNASFDRFVTPYVPTLYSCVC